jgi:hypothetical protein
MSIVIQEIVHDRIYLDTEMKVQTAGPEEGGPDDVDFRTL